jgi:hypothetical protein
MGNIGQTIAAASKLSRMYSQGMLKDVTEQNFARLATPGGVVVQSNHPAWVFGHCGLYFSRVMELCELPAGATVNPAGFDDVFKNGTPCLDDPAGTIYPKMNAITEHYFRAFDAAIAAIVHVDDALLMQEHPNPAARERLATKGAAAAFLMGGHIMSHMGQVSGWRRMMGLGSAM